MTVAVIDLGVGNTASMIFALERLGVSPRLTADPEVVTEAERVILPGVGAAGFAAARLHALGLFETLRTFPRPLLGVCLGQQLLFESSAEGDAKGLGRIPGRVGRLEPSPERPSPHMGWAPITVLRDDPLLEGVASGEHVYFVHGYAAPVTADTSASARFGTPFAAVVRRGSAMGCQFHPERSAAPGARILANFLSLPC